MSTRTQTEPPETATGRNFTPHMRASHTENVDRWALIVGISSYKHASLNLKYAHRDAQELYNLIQTPSGGNYRADHIRFLVDEDATTANITRALRSFLQKPAKEDLVLIYFACHGAPDLDRPKNIYLLTHDTEPDDIAGTALPMREIDTSLRENLNAERVVILADTCHSAAIGGAVGRRSNIDAAAEVNSYLQNLSDTKPGLALLTSAEANEVSQEDERWGGGHGVFTHFLLEGMRGKAEKEGIVTVGDLFEYVRENVKLETGYKQHPAIGPNPFDRNLPMSITAGLSAQERYDLGCRLYELGLLLDDRYRFESAAGQFDEAIYLSSSIGREMPKAYLQKAKALLALGEYEPAAETCDKAIALNDDATAAEAAFHLGIAQARRQDYKAAAKALNTFLKRRPKGDDSKWVGEYVKGLSAESAGSRFALLIGSDKILAYPNILPLQGPPNDVQLMKTALMKHGFQENNIQTLVCEQATEPAILKALNRLATETTPFDTVVVYYSGRSGSSATDSYLFVYDSGDLANAISSKKLHELMNRIPAGNKLLISDGAEGSGIWELVKAEGRYSLFDATSPGQLPMETYMEVEGKGTYYGQFSYALAQVLLQANPNITTYGEIADAVADAMKAKSDTILEQTPQFIGNRDGRMFVAGEDLLELFEFSQRKNFAPYARRALASRYARIQQQMQVAFPPAHCAFGRAFFEKGSYRESINALQTAVKQGQKTGVYFTLGRAYFIGQDYANALKSLRSLKASDDPQAPTAQVEQVLALLEKLEKEEKHALLVGIDRYKKARIPALADATGDVQAVKESLIDKFGFKEKNIKVLLDQGASRKAILDEFKRLAMQEETALFYYAGYGSYKYSDGTPTILSVDARQPNVEDITIKELSEIASGRFNLLTIIDAGWFLIDKPSADLRSMPPRMRQEKTGIFNAPVSKAAASWETIGQVSIYPRSFAGRHPGRLTESLAKSPKRGRSTKKRSQESFAAALVEVLNRPDSAKLTYVELVKEVAKKGTTEGPFIWGGHKDKRLFTNKLLHDRAQELFVEIEREPVRQIIELLRQLIDKRKGFYAEGHLNLGLAYALAGEYLNSIRSIERALAQQVDDTAEAHYHMGRVLFESGGDLADAVSELRKATELDPRNARAYYYLGQAIRALVERETLLEAEKAFRKYLEAGAPLGYGYEVQKFLDTRKVEQEESEKRKSL